MNARLNGTETPTPSIVTKVEIAWLLGAENEATAVSNGRTITLTALQDMANFLQATVGGTAPNAAGYALSSAALVSGTTYTPSVRITDSAYGVGAWTRSGAFTATVATTTTTTTSTTTTTTGAPGAGFTDTATWGTVSAGGGTATVTASLVTLDSQTTDKAALLYYKPGITRAAAHTIKAKVSLTSTNGSNETAMALALTQAIPVCDLANNVYADFYRNCGVGFWYNSATSSWGATAVFWASPATYQKWEGAWVTVGGAVSYPANNPTVSKNTVYTAIIVTTTTGVSFALKSADESTTIFQTTERPWSELSPCPSLGALPATMYPAMGDWYTDAFGEQVQVSSFSLT